MNSSILLRSFVVVVCLCAAVTGQCPFNTLTTTFAGGFSANQNSIMFDLVCTNTVGVTIQNFDFHLAPGVHTIEIWMVTGTFGGVTNFTYVGNETSSANWTLMGTATVTSNGNNVATPVPINVNHYMAPTEQRGFYMADTTGRMRYTGGAVSGTVFTGDANVDLLVGLSMLYPWGSQFGPRVFNTNMVYFVGNPPAEFQVNSPVADLRVNNQFVYPLCANIVNLDVQINLAGTVLSPATGTLTMSSDGNPGAAYDILISSVALVPLTGGGLSLGAGGEIVNLNLIGVSFLSLNAGLPGLVSFQSLPGANFPGATGGAFSLPFSLGAASAGTTISLQGVVLDATSPSGFVLTGATQIDIALTIVP